MEIRAGARRSGGRFLIYASFLYVVLGAPFVGAQEVVPHPRGVGERVPHSPPAPGEAIIEMDVPHRVDTEQPFSIDVWVSGASAPSAIYMEQNPDIAYSPRFFTVRPGERRTIRCTIERNRSGVAQIIASSDCCRHRSVSIDLGFQLRFAPRDGQVFRAGQTSMTGFDLVDAGGEQVGLDAPLDLAILASGAVLKDGPQSGRAVNLSRRMERGASTTPYFWLQPPGRWLRSSTTVAMELRNEHGDVLRRDSFEFTVPPPWWVQALAAVGGSWIWLVMALGTSKEGRGGRRLLWRMILATTSGILAYLLVRVGQAGFKVDTTGTAGFAVLGALVATSGADFFLRRLVPANRLQRA